MIKFSLFMLHSHALLSLIFYMYIGFPEYFPFFVIV